MTYTVSEMAALAGISASAVRYYDKEGLLPNISRSSAGTRRFGEKDIESLKLIEGLKAAGLSVSEIKQYVKFTKRGKDGVEGKKELLKKAEERTAEKAKQVRKAEGLIKYQQWLLQRAENGGSVKDVPTAEVPPEFRTAKKELETPVKKAHSVGIKIKR